MGRNAVRLASTILLLVLMTGGSFAQEPPPQELSLADLDALEEDAEESLSTIVRRQIPDLLALSALLILALVGFFIKSRALKYATLVYSVVYLGFVKSSLVSVVNIFALIDWSFPPFRDSISWYVFVPFAVVSTALWGRFYCGRICPFGALTQLLDKVRGSRLRFELPARIERPATYLKYLLLAAAIAYFLLTEDIYIYRYIEPFWMFTLTGSVTMWILLALLLVVTVFVRNFYCRYLCAAGAFLALISNLTLFRIKRWSECGTCKLCEKACEWRAIRGSGLAVTECLRCDDCERLYRDEEKCPHWLKLKKAS